MLLLILQAASTTFFPPLINVLLYCDNRGVIIHGTSPWVSLPKKQVQADLIRHIKYLAGTTWCKAAWEWVEVHAVERKRWQYCSLPKCLNNQADKLAKHVRYPLSSYKGIWNSHVGTLPLLAFWHMVQYYEIAEKAVSLHPIKLHVCHVAYIAEGSKELIILCTNSTVRLKQ